MARLKTRGSFRGLEVVLGVLALVGVVVLFPGIAHRQLLPLLQATSLVLVVVVLIVVVEVRARRQPR